mmetsp:Transcript_3498/g.6731  ORF Transcript_3498/g.6731 Transcript_3498/m.6731 type:complete len:1554 (-) Transcript_3498:110-4771(-)
MKRQTGLPAGAAGKRPKRDSVLATVNTWFCVTVERSLGFGVAEDTASCPYEEKYPIVESINGPDKGIVKVGDKVYDIAGFHLRGKGRKHVGDTLLQTKGRFSIILFRSKHVNLKKTIVSNCLKSPNGFTAKWSNQSLGIVKGDTIFRVDKKFTRGQDPVTVFEEPFSGNRANRLDVDVIPSTECVDQLIDYLSSEGTTAEGKCAPGEVVLDTTTAAQAKTVLVHIKRFAYVTSDAHGKLGFRVRIDTGVDYPIVESAFRADTQVHIGRKLCKINGVDLKHMGNSEFYSLARRLSKPLKAEIATFSSHEWDTVEPYNMIRYFDEISAFKVTNDQKGLGLQKGDIITEINGEDMASLGLDDFRKHVLAGDAVIGVYAGCTADPDTHDEDSTQNIEQNTHNMEQSTQNIEQSIQNIEQSIQNIEQSTEREENTQEVEEEEEEDLLVLTDEQVSIKCPVSMTIIADPVVGDQCTHLRPVDRRSFESLGMIDLRCPLCRKPVTRLVPCEDFKRALSTIPSGCEYLLVKRLNGKIEYSPFIADDKVGHSIDIVSTSATQSVSVKHENDANGGPVIIDLDSPGKAVVLCDSPKKDANNLSVFADSEEQTSIPKIKSESKPAFTGFTAKAVSPPVVLTPVVSPLPQLTDSQVELELSLLMDGKSAVRDLSAGLQSMALRFKNMPCNIYRPNIRKEVKISGVNVLFPFAKPLPPQLAFMSKMLNTLNKQGHALLESPTGTGKTASLLCASLAWQRHHTLSGWSAFDGRPRRIFYATRTHSQVRQISQGLKSTAYRPRMGVLASKRHTCVQTDILQNREISISQACAELRREGGCVAYKQCSKPKVVRRAGQMFLPSPVETDAHDCGGLYDIEDLKAEAARFQDEDDNDHLIERGACPDYLSQALAKLPTTQFIVCPYNYLLSPTIRSKIIEAEESPVFIFDEGHNIEPACLDEGSCTLDQFALIGMVRVVCHLMSMEIPHKLSNEYKIVRDNLRDLMCALDKLVKFVLGKGKEFEDRGARHLRDQKETEIVRYCGVHGNNGKLPANSDGLAYTRARGNLDGYMKNCADFAGSRKFFDAAGFSRGCSELSSKAEQVQSFFSENDSSLNCMRQSDKVLKEIASLFGVLELAFFHAFDYTFCVVATKNDLGPQHKLIPVHEVSDFSHSTSAMCCASVYGGNGGVKHGDYLVPGLPEVRGPKWKISLRINLHNAGVIFQSCQNQAHSCIIASGTLFPMEPCELGKGFADRLANICELGHVVAKTQLYVSVVPRAPSGRQLDSRFSVIKSFKPGTYESDLANTIIPIIERGINIPGGVIIFLPSYGRLAAIEREWEQLGAIDRLETVRGLVMFEPRSAGSASFEQLKLEFREEISAGRSATIFAVYRGRMSEGLDFKDEYCRAVFLVGIPFPSFESASIKHKINWNDARHKISPSIIDGQTWYKFQAYRAINQALGRVIRHRLDFGAIFFLDCRFDKSAYSYGAHPTTYITKWVKKWIRHDGEQSNEHVISNVREHFDTIPLALKEKRDIAVTNPKVQIGYEHRTVSLPVRKTTARPPQFLSQPDPY